MLKLLHHAPFTLGSLITVQDNTMLKPISSRFGRRKSLITVQDNTMLKPIARATPSKVCLITVQDNTMLKQRFVL